MKKLAIYCCGCSVAYLIVAMLIGLWPFHPGPPVSHDYKVREFAGVLGVGRQGSAPDVRERWSHGFTLHLGLDEFASPKAVRSIVLLRDDKPVYEQRFEEGLLSSAHLIKIGGLSGLSAGFKHVPETHGDTKVAARIAERYFMANGVGGSDADTIYLLRIEFSDTPTPRERKLKPWVKVPESEWRKQHPPR